MNKNLQNIFIKWVVGILAIAFILKENLPESYDLSETNFFEGCIIIHRLLLNSNQIFYFTILLGFGLFFLFNSEYFVHKLYKKFILYSICLSITVGVILGYLNLKSEELPSSFSLGITHRDAIFNMNFLKYSILSGIGISALIYVYKEQVEEYYNNSWISKYFQKKEG